MLVFDTCTVKQVLGLNRIYVQLAFILMSQIWINRESTVCRVLEYFNKELFNNGTSNKKALKCLYLIDMRLIQFFFVPETNWNNKIPDSGKQSIAFSVR